MAQDPNKIETPVGAKKEVAQAAEIEIRVMPKDFLGKEAYVKDAPKTAAPAPAPVPAPVITQPAPTVPTPPPVPVKKKSRLPIILLILGIIFLAVIGGGAYYFLQSIEPVVEPTPEPEPEPTPEPEPEPVAITQGKDTDSDGLSDREESLYGTELRNPDTDGDTFLDGNEVFHRYDPLGYSPSTLLDTGSVVEFTSPDNSFTLTYPRTWTLTNTTDGLIVRSSTSASFDVSESSKEGFVPTGEEGLTKNGYITYTSADKMETVVLVGERVYVFTYDLGESTTIDYLQTYQMFVNSFLVHE